MTEVACPGCRQRDDEIADLKRRVAELEALVRDLTARLGANATNSSTPPSANPPDAPRPVTKSPTGNKPGAQPGHPAHLRRRLPPERLTRTVPLTSQILLCDGVGSPQTSANRARNSDTRRRGNAAISSGRLSSMRDSP